jgi:hypothetical protein
MTSNLSTASHCVSNNCSTQHIQLNDYSKSNKQPAMMIKITGRPSNPTSATAASQEASPEIKDARTPENKEKITIDKMSSRRHGKKADK